MQSVRYAGSVWLPFGSSPGVRCVCVRSCSNGVRVSPPLRVGVARALRAVPVQGAGRAFPGGLCPSAYPATVPCSPYLARRGVAWSPRPLALFGVTRPPAGRPSFFVLPFRAVGAARGRLGGTPFAWVWGVRGRALSHVRPSVLRGVWPGPATHWLLVWGVRLRGPVIDSTARALASYLCSLWGRHKDARGGRLLPGRGASRVGRSPTPNRPSFGACGRGPLATGCGCGGCGRGKPSSNPDRSLLRAGFARCGGSTRTPGGGGASCLGLGRPGSGALPLPTARPLGRAAGAHYPLAVGAGGVGVGTRHPAHSACSCELALRAVRAAQGRPGGGASCLGVGSPGRALSHPRPLVF